MCRWERLFVDLPGAVARLLLLLRCGSAPAAAPCCCDLLYYDCVQFTAVSGDPISIPGIML